MKNKTLYAIQMTSGYGGDMQEAIISTYKTLVEAFKNQLILQELYAKDAGNGNYIDYQTRSELRKRHYLRYRCYLEDRVSYKVIEIPSNVDFSKEENQ